MGDFTVVGRGSKIIGTMPSDETIDAWVVDEDNRDVVYKHLGRAIYSDGSVGDWKDIDGNSYKEVYDTEKKALQVLHKDLADAINEANDILNKIKERIDQA